ncbi:MAG: hypothetical protein QM755_08875 [Luteolibacter sp.]
MMFSGSAAVRVKKFLLGLSLGLLAGILLAHTPAWISQRHAVGTKAADDVRADESTPARLTGPRVRQRKDQALQSVTATQLTQLGQSTAQPLSFAPWLEAFANASRLPEDKRAAALRESCASSIKLLSLNEKDAEAFESTIIGGVQRLMELEQTSVPIRETKPGTLVLDFDALAGDRQQILEDMRANLRRDLGGRAMEDLDVLLGFDSFTEGPGQTQNCEITISRKNNQWHVAAIEPDRTDPSAGMMENLVFPGDMSEKEVFQGTIQRSAGHRYGHVGSMLPATFSPVP